MRVANKNPALEQYSLAYFRYLDEDASFEHLMGNTISPVGSQSQE